VKREHIIRVRDGREFVLGRRTWIMGILNVTPDSFSDGGRYLDPDRAAAHGLRLIEDGARILDIGGESTRPGSDPVAAAEEIKRILPVIRAIRRQSDVLLSVDTTKTEVAREALDAGADIINDISAGRFDTNMLSLAAARQTPIILMHMLGTPKTMQVAPYYDEVLPEIKAFLRERIEKAAALGVPRDNIIIDPGIGFGKRQEDNLSLLRNLQSLDELDQPILIGVSRKAFIGRILNAPPEDRLEGTIAAALISMLHGAHIVRVHDVASVNKALTVAEAIMFQDRFCRTHAPAGIHSRDNA
jgi:dihydropteroate synthase